MSWTSVQAMGNNRADVFQINSKKFPCAIDYLIKFLIAKEMEKIFAEYVVPKEIMSDACTKFISQRCINFC